MIIFIQIFLIFIAYKWYFVFNLTENKNNFNINDIVNLMGRNWHNAVGYADIRDMHINKNGNIELFIADVYDFNVGEILPYFYAYRVIIRQEELI